MLRRDFLKAVGLGAISALRAEGASPSNRGQDARDTQKITNGGEEKSPCIGGDHSYNQTRAIAPATPGDDSERR